MIERTTVLPSAARPFSDLFVQAPPLVRGFLDSALRLGDLRQLLSQARNDSGGNSLSRAVLNLLNVTLHVSARDMEHIVSSGPLVIVANHPFGMLDGLLLDSLVSSVRADLKIFTTALLCGIEEFQDRFLSLDVLSGKSATFLNARSLRAGIEWLRDGHVLAIFPAGEVSHWGTEALRIVDSPWSVLPVRCAARTNAPVLPVYFGGRNSLAFQLAGLLHPRLRTMRLPGELLNKSGRVVEVRIGSPIPSQELAERGSPETAASYLWARTYALGHRESLPAPRRRPLPFSNARRAEPMVEAVGGAGAEIARLEAEGCRIVESGRYSVYAVRGDRIPVLLREIGRLREVTFRAVGEGTGRAFDLDDYDPYYRHLILWNKEDARIAGSYRLAWTEASFPTLAPVDFTPRHYSVSRRSFSPVSGPPSNLDDRLSARNTSASTVRSFYSGKPSAVVSAKGRARRSSSAR